MDSRADAPAVDDAPAASETSDIRSSGRDVDLAGRDLLELARLAAAAGDAGAAQALVTGALGSTEPAVAGEAATLSLRADGTPEGARPRLRRGRRGEAEPR